MEWNAWLNAVPDGQKGDPKPRRSQFPEGSAYLDPPHLSSYEEHLVGLWREAGTISQKGMGIGALDWDVLIAWAERFYSDSFIEWVKNPDNKRHKPIPLIIKYCTLPDIDLQIIRQMSQEYVWMSHEATLPNYPCPKEILTEEVDAEANAEDIYDGLKSLGFILDDGSTL